MWSPQPALGGALWSGNQNLATTRQLLSTSSDLTTHPELFSTTTGLRNYTTLTSNVLQTEINSIVAGGTTSLWANYRAITNVDLSGNSLSNADKITARFLSTLDLQVSSINGAEVILTASNVTIQNVEFKNGAVTASNVTTSNNVITRTAQAIGAAAAAVSQVNQAVGGVLSNTFGVVQQAYWGVAVAGQVVDLANGVVQLATGAQALTDSRELNTIAGPQGPPGQTTPVYETFNHTTQLQFSTIGSPIYTVFRTTDQRYTNQTLGREVFVSTLIPAGTKVVRSVSDPLNIPVISTQLLSTTNYIQSFGQWAAVLADDYNLKVSTISADYIRASSISTLNLSTGAASISSINGVNVTTLLTPAVLPSGLVSTPWNIGLVSTPNLLGLVSTPNLVGLVSTPNLVNLVSTANLSNLQSLTISTGTIGADTANVRNLYVSTLYASTVVTSNLVDTYIFTSSAVLSSLTITGGQQFSTLFQPSYVITGIAASTATQYTSISSLTQNIMKWTVRGVLTASELIADLPGGTSIYSGNEGEWLGKLLMYSSIYVAPIIIYLLNANTVGDFFDFQNKSGVTGNTVTFYQGGAAVLVVQPLDANIYRWTWNGSVFVLSSNPTPSGQAVINEFTMTQGFDKTTFSTANELVIDAGNTSFTNPVNIPYGFITNIYGTNATLGALTTGAISSSGGIAFTTPSTITDLSKTTSLNALTGSQLRGHFNNILNYEFDTTVVTEPIITYPFPPGGSTEFFWQQVGTWGGVINTFAAGGNPRVTLFLGIDTAVPPPASGFTDIQNTNQANGIQVYYTGGNIVVPIGSIYRFSWTYSPLVWSINTTPSPATATTLTNFTVKQDFAGVAISTSDILNVNATSIFLNAPYTQAAKFVAEAGYFSTLQTEFISTGNLQIANISTGTIAATGAITAGGNVTAGGNLTAAGNVSGVNGTFTGALSGVSLTTTGDVNARNIISISSITNAVYTSNANCNINQYNVKDLTTPVYYNTRTSTLGTGSGGSYIPSLPVYGNALQVYTYPGLADVGINNGLPGGQYYYLRSDGTTRIGTTFPGTNPAFPNPWWSSIITVYNNVVGDYLVFDPTGAKGECYIQTMGTTALNYQMYSGAGVSYVAPATVPAYYKLIWNTFSNAVLTPVSAPYTPVLQNQLTSIDLGVNNTINLIASNVTFANKQVEMFQQTFDGYLVRGANGLYSKADAAGTITNPSGKTYPISDWACICSLAGINVYGQFNLALNEQLVTTGNDGAGNWFAHCYCTTATISGGNNPHVYWNVAVTMVPRIIGTPVSFQTATNLGDEPPPIAQELPWVGLSSITASTFTVEATENIAILANLTSPAFVSTGSIYIAGTNNTNLIGNITAIGGFTDVDLDALTGNVNVVATAGDINLSAYNNVNLTGSNGLIYTGASKLWGSNVGNSLGLYRPLRFYYEPPTAAGQSAEINIEAHPADAGVRFSLRYGVDLAAGYAYLLCEWPGYIVVPMKLFGQDIALEGGETIHINANSGDATITATGATNISSTTVNVRAPNINLYGDVGTNGTLYMNSNNIEQIRTLYFQTSGNIDAYQYAGVNYLNINAPTTTGSGTGRLNFYGNTGNLTFDDNVTIGGNGTNYVGVYNQYGYVQIASDQNIYIGGGGGSIGGVSAVNLSGFTVVRHNGSYAGGLISQIVNQAASASTPGSRFGTLSLVADNPAVSGESGVQISLETANYGGAIFGGITQGVGSFISLATNNGAGGQTERMRISGVSGYVGINTTTPYYQLDVIGDTRVSGNLYANNNIYFGYGGSINSAQSGGVNYLDINAPPTTGSGTGQIRIFGNNGNSLTFDNNIALGGNGSNQVGMFNQYGSIYLDTYQNVHLVGAGSHRGSENQIQVSGLIYSDSRIYTGTSGQGFLQQHSNGFIETRVDYGAYGGLTMNGYFQVCQTGTTTAVFTVPSDTNGNMSYNNGTGGFGIGTTSPAYKLDVAGDAHVSGTFNRTLSSSVIAQPVLQYGTTSGSGTSGSVTVTLPTGYTTAASYVAFGVMQDSTEAKIAVNRTSYISITIYWSQGGSGTHTIAWNTMGT